MNEFYSTGPAICVVGAKMFNPSSPTKPNILPVVLGTFEDPPEIEEIVVTATIDADEGGGVPTDRAYLGKEARITGVLNRFNLQLALEMSNVGQPFNSLANAQGAMGIDQGNVGGHDSYLTIGRLLTLEGSTYDIWLLYPNSFAPAGAITGLIPGYHFLAGFIEKSVTVSGCIEMQKAVVIQCQRKKIYGFNREPVAAPNTVVPVLPTGAGFQAGQFIAIPGGGGDPSNAMLGGRTGNGTQVIGSPMIVKVVSVDGTGTITSVQVINPGNYIVAPANPALGVPITGTPNLDYFAHFTVTIGTTSFQTVPMVRYQLYDFLGVNGGSMSNLYATVAQQLQAV